MRRSLKAAHLSKTNLGLVLPTANHPAVRCYSSIAFQGSQFAPQSIQPSPSQLSRTAATSSRFTLLEIKADRRRYCRRNCNWQRLNDRIEEMCKWKEYKSLTLSTAGSNRGPLSRIPNGFSSTEGPKSDLVVYMVLANLYVFNVCLACFRVILLALETTLIFLVLFLRLSISVFSVFSFLPRDQGTVGLQNNCNVLCWCGENYRSHFTRSDPPWMSTLFRLPLDPNALCLGRPPNICMNDYFNVDRLLCLLDRNLAHRSYSAAYDRNTDSPDTRPFG